MASPILITRDNFTTNLVRSSQGREGIPDGNIFLDPLNSVIQLITLSELATVNLGSGLEANPLTDTDKIQALALYFFIIQEIQADSTLQNSRFAMDAVSNRMGKLVGATAFLNSIKLAEGAVNIAGVGGALGDDRLKLADSGFQEFADGAGGNTLIDRIYHGPKSLNAINSTSQPFFMVANSLSEADRQAAVPTDFSKTGSVNEVIQTLGTTANGDTLAGNFDNLAAVLIIGVRDYGFSVGEVNSLATGVSELGAYSQGYGLGNAAVNDVAAITEADVFGGLQVAPFTTMGFTRLAVAETVTGFIEGDGLFTDKITNTGGGSLIQLRAFMDKLMQQDIDQNDNTAITGSYIPKRAEPLYTINSAGKLVSRQGLMIENIPAADAQGAILTDDAGTARNRPITTSIIIFLSTAWFDDTLGWFRMMYLDGATTSDFDTATAVTVDDASSVPVAGNKTDARIFAVTGGYELRISYSYDTNTQAGLSAGVDKDVILQLGGVNNTKSKTFSFTISSTSFATNAETEKETN